MSTELVSIAGVSFINTNNGFYVSSREVADKFGKNHRDIVRVISTAEQSIISANNEDFNVRNFTRVGYIDAKGENRTEILMTRDGFAFIALSLTGQAAVEWKLRFLDAFNALESSASKTAELQAELDRKEGIIQQLRAQAGKKALPSRKGQFALIPQYRESLPGFQPRVEFHRVEKLLAKEPESTIGQIRQIQLTMEGLARKIDELQRRIGLK
jgi:Rha family phage regulatory protein